MGPKVLSKEQRAAKFASKPQIYGLRSRGHRKLTIDEQEELYADLENQPRVKRLENLRILREAILSTENSAKSGDLEIRIYARSIQESIIQKELEALQPMLSHITKISKDKLWARLQVISLANRNQFAEALNFCTGPEDWQYVTSVVTEDQPLREKLIADEKSELAIQLMKMIDERFNSLRIKLEVAFQHPGAKRPPSTTAAA